MKKERLQFLEELEGCKDFYLETTRLVGAAKAINEMASLSRNAEKRVQMKNIFRGLFRQLVTDLYILVEDRHSNINLKRLVKRFEDLYGGREKELGLKVDIDREKLYLKELEGELELFEELRKNFCSHYNYLYKKDWEIDIEKISILLVSIEKLIDTMSITTSVPESFTKQVSSYSYRTSTNLEEEYYKKLKKHLVWRED